MAESNTPAASTPSPAAAARLLGRFLRRGGFIVIGVNGDDPSPGGPFEAWAYRGPLDFDRATPVAFGLGAGAADALVSLADRLRTGRIRSPTATPRKRRNE